MREERLPVSVAIVNYNTRDLLRACINSVLDQGPVDIVVGDNASSDGSAAMVKAECPECRLIENRINIGYGPAAHQAITSCDSRYVLLLNSDTLLRPKAIEALVMYMEDHPKVAIVGPRILNNDGTLQRSTFSYPIPWHVFLDHLPVSIRSIPLFRPEFRESLTNSSSHPVAWVLGAALMIRRQAYDDVGGFNPSIFMYYEEVDLCFRLAKLGWQVHYTPAAEVIHTGGASTNQVRAAMLFQLYSSLAQFYHMHYTHQQLSELVTLITAITFLRLIRDRIILQFTKDQARRSFLKANITAWQRLLSEKWYLPGQEG